MKPTYTSEDVNKVVACYQQGHATRQVATMVGLSPTIVAKIVKDAGISRERIAAWDLSRKRSVPDDWSFSPLTPEKAWMLGLIYGDGSLDRRGYLIPLTSGDRDVIDHVNQIMGGKIGIDSHPTYWNLQICSKRLWQELHTLYSLTPNKSSTIQHPDIADAMKPHFVRGLIDSDGCWYSDTRSSQPRLKFQFLSLSEMFVKQLRQDFITFVGVSEKNHIQVRTVGEGKGYCLQYGNKDAKDIGKWVYAPSTSETRCARTYAYWDRFA
jgi:intein-encoded DNA endonuclease-like protein